jgi:hypothetical protein
MRFWLEKREKYFLWCLKVSRYCRKVDGSVWRSNFCCGRDWNSLQSMQTVETADPSTPLRSGRDDTHHVGA